MHGISLSLRGAARTALALAFGLCLLIWGAGQLPPRALQTALLGLPAIAPWRWIAAIALTGLSFIAMGRMEASWHITLRLNTQPWAARRTGRLAVAVGQCVGAASVVAALLRWRLLRDTARTADIARQSLAASLSFMLCWALTALVAIWWIALAQLPSLSLSALPLLVTCAALALWRYGPLLWRHRRLAAAVMGWCQLDLLCASLVFALLAPADLPLADVLAVFVLALGAGLATHLPMGLGAFDLVVLALLPVPVADMLPALLAYRLIYGVLPGVAGLVSLHTAPVLPGRDALRHLLRDRAPALWGLAAQGASVWQDARGAALVGQAPLAKAIIGETLGQTPTALSRTGRYKCNARTTARLRRRGWTVMVIATESVIDPQTWSLDGPDRAALRRKLRQAQAKGATVAIIDPADHGDTMSRIAAAWARAHGGERGFSMGRYQPHALRDQLVLGIHAGGTLRGFVTFQTGPQDWVLDLIRYDGTLPAGAIHAAMAAGFAAAKSAGVTEVNLGATVAQRGPFGWLGRRHAGLAQFKGSFAPQTRPLYYAAPGALRFLWSATAVLWAVQRPHARLTSRLGRLSFAAPHATEDATVRSGPPAQTEATDDKRIRPTSRRARLDPRRWRHRDQSVQHGSFFRRRARDVERRTS
ncbi:phosphatidylglycerol lysyltransferase domain-containing protein [Loktanella sp. M215]|uniref:phosphatidylglycerol lysyltransferase domain-containing protein n=1 Tax=Loktanella sp. M215 TaxID=2675431 RepID=UPI001F364FEC|nr:DUF2156 domain-containing protein [Loktanella sp. M215]